MGGRGESPSMGSRAFKANRDHALKQQRGRCYYCLDPLDKKSLTGDHKEPKASGGSNMRHNVAAACFWCNQLKGEMPEASFMRLIERPPNFSGSDRYWMIWGRRRSNLKDME